MTSPPLFSERPILNVTTPTNTLVAWREGAVHLQVRNTGDRAEVRLEPPLGIGLHLPASAYVVVEVENLSPDHQMRLQMQLQMTESLDDKKDSLPHLKTGIVLNPMEKGVMRLSLSAYAQIPLKQHEVWKPRDLAGHSVDALIFQLALPCAEGCPLSVDCLLSGFYLEGELCEAEEGLNWSAPFVDSFGQFIHRDWPEKVKDESVFVEDLAQENAALKPPPSSWNEFGGWAHGPQLEATGHFRMAKHEGRWWFVDPAGCLFFSFGIDVLRHYTDNNNGFRQRAWYETPPPKNGWMSFTHWNLQKKFAQSDYLADYYAFILRRLDSWGINTIGRWGARQLTLFGKKPYLVHLFDTAAKVPAIAGMNFYDCFHPEFESSMVATVEAERKEASVSNSVEDPMCIGYVVDNEKDFDGMMAGMIAQDPETCHTKAAFLAEIQHVYMKVSALNVAWGTSFQSWADVAALRTAPAGAGFEQDALAFQIAWLDRYFSVCRKAVKALSPDKLYFACAFNKAWPLPLIWEVAARHADVLSTNIDTYSVANLSPQGFQSAIDCPLLVSAFNFGCADRGMFSGGLSAVADQAERARSLNRFVRGALSNPLIVGCHWFQYRDQPLVGRHDGECYQIGFVDVCDRPYPELTEAARELGDSLYA